jgi:hypothetical protein
VALVAGWALAAPAAADATGADPEARCFSTHLLEAIELNRERGPAYARVTGGRSREVTEWLIISELAALPVARWFEMREAPYRRAGIPILCEAFISMEETPPLLPRVAPPPTPWEGPSHAPSLPREVRTAFQRMGMAGADAVLTAALAADPESPYGCMVRHLVESAARIARLAPEHARRAAEAGLPPPDRLHWDLVRLHLASLPFAAWLDARAAPLQAGGVPVICRDVPHVPLPEAR